MSELNTNKNIETENINNEVENILLDKGINKEKLDDQLDKNKVKAEKLLKNKEKTEKVLKKAKWLCEMLANIPFVGKLFDGISNMCDLISDYNKGLYKNIPLATIVSILAAILYMVCPVDLLPDALPLIGVLDDAAILYGVSMAAKNDIEAYNKWKNANNTAETI